MYTTYLQRKEIGDTWCKNSKKLGDFGWNDSIYIVTRGITNNGALPGIVLFFYKKIHLLEKLQR